MPGSPLPLIFHEYLDDVAAGLRGPVKRGVHPAADGHVSAEAPLAGREGSGLLAAHVFTQPREPKMEAGRYESLDAF